MKVFHIEIVGRRRLVVEASHRDAAVRLALQHTEFGDFEGDDFLLGEVKSKNEIERAKRHRAFLSEQPNSSAMSAGVMIIDQAAKERLAAVKAYAEANIIATLNAVISVAFGFALGQFVSPKLSLTVGFLGMVVCLIIMWRRGRRFY